MAQETKNELNKNVNRAYQEIRELMQELDTNICYLVRPETKRTLEQLGHLEMISSALKTLVINSSIGDEDEPNG